MINFLNSTNRSYNGADLNKINEAILDTGILDTNGTDFLVEKVTGLDVRAKKGSAIITVESGGDDTNVIGSQNADTVLTCVDDATNYIIYRVYQSVIDGDTIDTDGTNSDACEVVTTLPATDPYILLATVVVPDGATSLTDEMITDNRSYAPLNEKLTSQILELVYADNPLNTIDVYSDGLIINNNTGSDVISNTDTDAGSMNVVAIYQADPLLVYNGSIWQKFTPTIDEIGSIFIQKGITDVSFDGNVIFDICSVDVSGEIDTVLESFSYTNEEFNNIDAYSFIELILTLPYTSGTEYGINIRTTTSDTDGNGAFSTANHIDPNIEELERFNNYTFGGTDSYSVYAGRSLSMRISAREIVNFGSLDNEFLGQTFIADSKSMHSIKLKKGDDVGTPTGSIIWKLYEADGSDEPTGDVLYEKEMTESEWNDIEVDSVFEVIMPSALTINQKYIVYGSPDNVSDVNYRELWAGKTTDNYADGKMRAYDGTSWSDINYDLWLQVIEGSHDKFVKTKPNGKIADELINLDLPSVFHHTLGSIAWSGESHISISPSGKYIAHQSSFSSTANIKIYEIQRRTLKYIGQFTLSGGDHWSTCWGKDDEQFASVSNDNGYDETRMWVDNPIELAITGGTAHLNTDGDHQYSESNTSTTGAVFYHPEVDRFFVWYSGTSYKLIDPYDYTLDTTASSIGITISEARALNGLDTDGNLCYFASATSDSTFYTFSHDGDNTFTKTIQSGFSVEENYYNAVCPLKVKGEFLKIVQQLVHETTSTSSPAIGLNYAETHMFDY